jgi:hypothetical protein
MARGIGGHHTSPANIRLCESALPTHLHGKAITFCVQRSSFAPLRLRLAAGRAPFPPTLWRAVGKWSSPMHSHQARASLPSNPAWRDSLRFYFDRLRGHRVVDSDLRADFQSSVDLRFRRAVDFPFLVTLLNDDLCLRQFQDRPCKCKSESVGPQLSTQFRDVVYEVTPREWGQWCPLKHLRIGC